MSEERIVNVALTERDIAILKDLMNRLNGVEVMRMLIPIHDKLVAAEQSVGKRKVSR